MKAISSIERLAACVWRVDGIIGGRTYYYATKDGARFKYGYECDTGAVANLTLEIQLKQMYVERHGTAIFDTPRQADGPGRNVTGLPPVIKQVA